MRKLRNAVLQIARKNSTVVTSGLDGRLRNWDRDLENGKITASDAVGKVKGEFRYNWSNDDYRELEKAIK